MLPGKKNYTLAVYVDNYINSKTLSTIVCKLPKALVQEKKTFLYYYATKGMVPNRYLEGHDR